MKCQAFSALVDTSSYGGATRIIRGMVMGVCLTLLLIPSSPVFAVGAGSPAGSTPTGTDSSIQAAEKPSGLKAGNTIRIRKKNMLITGVIVRVDPDRDPLTVFTSNTSKQLVYLDSVERIIPTGGTMVLGPPHLDKVRSYPVYRLELLQGTAIEGVLTRLPTFEIESSGKRQQLAMTAQVTLVETSPVQTSPASGLIIGNKVRCVNMGDFIVGTVAGLTSQSGEAILVKTATGESVILSLRDVKRIRAIENPLPGQNQALPSPPVTPGIDTRAHEVTTTSGRMVRGRIVSPPAFDIDTGKGEIKKGLWSGIEVIERF